MDNQELIDGIFEYHDKLPLINPQIARLAICYAALKKHNMMRTKAYRELNMNSQSFKHVVKKLKDLGVNVDRPPPKYPKVVKKVEDFRRTFVDYEWHNKDRYT